MTEPGQCFPVVPDLFNGSNVTTSVYIWTIVKGKQKTEERKGKERGKE
jgi:hypothetical protein